MSTNLPDISTFAGRWCHHYVATMKATGQYIGQEDRLRRQAKVIVSDMIRVKDDAEILNFLLSKLEMYWSHVKKEDTAIFHNFYVERYNMLLNLLGDNPKNGRFKL